MSDLALFSSNEATRRDLAAAGRRIGLRVVMLTGAPEQLVQLVTPSFAVRGPGDLVGTAITAGAKIQLSGPTASWFVGLGEEITGRIWHLANVEGARELIGKRGPHFLKLADAKVRAFPARRYRSIDELEEALAPLNHGPGLQLLGTAGWLDIASEYRLFTDYRQVLTSSPYLIEDETWSPLLAAHRASFHQEASQYVSDVLARLPDQDVPPAAALDVARLTDGRFVVLEANQSWSAAPYGCNPDAVLQSVLTANRPTDPSWQWSPPRDLNPTSTSTAQAPPSAHTAAP